MCSGRILAISTVIVTVMAAGDTSCPQVCTCPSLYRADCHSDSLTNISKNLVSDVRFLNATGNNFSSLEKGAFNVLHIKILDLSNSTIDEIQNDALSQLEYLIFLYLSRNKIVTLDQNVFTMNRRLEFLKLDHNTLSFQHGRPFLNIPSLKSLDISSCSITSVPEETFVKLPNLEELTLSRNNLQELPPKVFLHLKSLKYLYLSHNILRAVHEDWFAASNKLLILDLSNNVLQTLQPQVFTFLKSLEMLKLSGNRLKTIDFDVFVPLISLERLYLEKNVLNALNGSHFSVLNNLTHLDISGNHLDSLKLLSLCRLTNLTYLKLSDNRLACDCAVWELWNWSLENGVRMVSTCDEPDFEFSVKNFESFQSNNSCNVTVCGFRNATENSEQLPFPAYLYVIIIVVILLVSVGCGVIVFVVVRHRNDFFKRKDIQINLIDYPHARKRQKERFAPDQRWRISEDFHRHEGPRENGFRMGHSVSLRVFPIAEHRNIRHSYQEHRVSSAADDDRGWSNADTLPSNNTASVFLPSMYSYDQKLEKRKNRSISEPKLKVSRKELSTERSLHTPVNHLSISTLEYQSPLTTTEFENVHDASSSESETSPAVERL